MAYASLQLNFVRNLSDGGSRDDIMRVKKTETPRLFCIEYEDRTGSIRNRAVATESEVLDFVESVFTLVPVDEDAFQYVQLTCPNFPAILLSTCSIRNEEVQTAIWRVIRATLRNWPAETKRSTEKLRNAAPLSA
uniref:Uncharacterized protein n=1 Tax=viral metagenome TaxID=1070528 RepID=A0A6C0I621_9ZZZZ